jgi:hypothetical protein
MPTLLRRRGDPARQRARFLARYRNRVLLVHRGLEPAWADELRRQGGGAGYFRIDARRPPGRPETALEWVVHRWLLPLEEAPGLPLPWLVAVSDEAIRVRHLVRAGQVVHPGEIPWFLDEMVRRHHAVLRPASDGFRVEAGIAVADNDAELP